MPSFFMVIQQGLGPPVGPFQIRQDRLELGQGALQPVLDIGVQPGMIETAELLDQTLLSFSQLLQIAELASHLQQPIGGLGPSPITLPAHRLLQVR